MLVPSWSVLAPLGTYVAILMLHFAAKLVRVGTVWVFFLALLLYWLCGFISIVAELMLVCCFVAIAML